MKQLTSYIKEDFKLSKTTKINNIVPETLEDLGNIVYKRYLKTPEYLDLRDIDIRNIDDFHDIEREMNGHNYAGLFCQFKKVRVIDITGWDTTYVTDMAFTFCGCSRLREIKGIEHLKVSNCRNFKSMFYGDSRLLSLNIENWNINQDILQNSDFMFYNVPEKLIPSWFKDLKA